MKKTILALALFSVTGLVQAQHRHHNYYATGPAPHYHHHHHRHYNSTQVLGALAVGGLIGYALTRPNPVVVEQPVYIQQPVPVYVERDQPKCGYWREVQYSNGQIYRERICSQ